MNCLDFNKKTTVDPIVHQWCFDLSGLTFRDMDNAWFGLQEKTSNILNDALATKNKSNLIIANMIHTVAPRFYFQQTTDASIEDTHVHQFISYTIKQIFGMEQQLSSQWANGGLEKVGNFDASTYKPDCTSATTRLELSASIFW